MSRISYATTVGFLVLLVGVALFGIHLSSMMALMAFIGTFVIYNPTGMLSGNQDSTQPLHASEQINKRPPSSLSNTVPRRQKPIAYVGSVPNLQEISGKPKA